MTSVTINKDNIKIKKNDGMRAKITPTTKTGRLLTHTIMDMQDGGLPSNEKMNEMSEILIKVLEAERKNTGDMKTQKMLHQLQIVIDDWQQTMNTKNHDETIQRLIQIVGKQGSDLSKMRMDNVNFDQETLNIGENFRKLVPKLVGLSKAVIKDSAFRELLLSLLDVGKRNFKDNKDVLNVDRGHSGPHVAKNIPPPPPLPRDDYDYDYDNVDRGRRVGKLDKGLHKGTSTKSYTNQRSTPPYLRKTDHTLTVENRDNLGYNDYDNRTTTKVETTGLGQQPGFQSDFDKEFQHFEKKEHNQIGQQTGSLAPPYIGEMERGTYAPPPPAPPLPQSLRVNRNVNQPLGGNREHPEFINIEPEKHTTVIEREREYHTTKKGQSIPVPPPPPSPNDLYSVNRNQKLVRDDDYIGNNRKPKSSLIDLLREDIQDTDTVKMDRTAQVLKSKVKQLDVKITDSEREQLIDKAIYALISIRSKPQYRSLFKNIFEIYTELSKMWRKVSTRPELKQEYTKSAVILNEIRILLERASGRSIETWLGHFRDFQYIMKDKTYLKIVSGIEDLVLDKNEKYTTPEAMKAKMNDIQRNVEKLNNQYGQVLGNLLDESAEIIRGIANDPQIAKLTQDTNLLFMQMFTDEAGRPSPAVAFDSLMRIKSVFLPVLIRNLQVFNLPTIFLENEQIEFTLSDIALQTKHILPDMFHFDFEANMDLNVRRNTREGKFALRINVRPISIDLDNVSYNFKKKSGFRFRDYGVLDISIRNASFFIDVAVYLDKDEIAEFEVRRVRTDLGKIKIDIINAKHEAMDKMATSLFLGGITKRLNKMISEKIHDALQNGLFTRINDGLVRAEHRRKEQRIKQRKLKKERAINRKRMTIRKRGVGTTKVKKNKKHGRVRGKVAKGKTTKGKVVKGKVAKGKVAKGKVVSQSEESSYVVEEKYEEKPTLGGKKVEEKREVKRPHGTKVETKTEKKGKKISQKREVEHPTGKKVVVDKKKDVKHHDSDTHELRHHGDKKRDLKHAPHDLTHTEEVELGKIDRKRDMEDIREVSSSISDEERPRDRIRDKGRMSKV